ncbi:MAG TPA: hypothetical protein VD905_19615 [Flavobacteriales bacterium]|nr:hypothetical protein [Flavobacteriales bacterium]
MKTWAKWTIGLGTVGVGTLCVYLYRLSKTNNGLDVIPSVRVHSLYPFTLAIDAEIKNPTNTAITVMQPYVKLFYKDTPVGTSNLVNTEIPIPKYGSVKLPQPIMLTIPLLGLFSIGGTLLNDLTSGQPIKLKVQPFTSLKTPVAWKTITLDPLEITLNNPAPKA